MIFSRFKVKTIAVAMGSFLSLSTHAGSAVSTATNTIGSISSGTGYASSEICTRVIQGGENYNHVVNDYVKPVVQPLPLVWWINYQKGQKVTVSTVVPGLKNARVSYYRKGLGCTVIPSDSASDQQRLQQQPISLLTYSTPTSLPWPYGDQLSAGISSTQKSVLDTSANTLFAENQKVKKYTNAFLVAHDGKLVYERYANGYTREMPLLGWSMTKTLTTLVAALMASEGRIQLDSPAFIPSTDVQKKSITWINLMNMASGLKWVEGATGGADSDLTTMLFNQKNQAQYVADRPVSNKPGTVFNYSTGDSNLLMYGLKEKAGGSSQAIYNYYQQRLFQPLGVKSGVIEFDYSGNPIGGARGVLRPIDWLRVGQMYLNQGKTPDGTQLIAPAVFSKLLQPSPADAGYAANIWLKESQRTKVSSSVFNKMPNDAYFLGGRHGQYVMVIPSKKLVILRMGVSIDELEVQKEVMNVFSDIAAQM